MASYSSWVYSLSASGQNVYISADSRMAPAIRYKVEDDPNDSSKAIVYLQASIRAKYYSGWTDTTLSVSGEQVFRGRTYCDGDPYSDADMSCNGGTIWTRTAITVDKTSSVQTKTYSASLTLNSSGYNTTTISVSVSIPAIPTYTASVAKGTGISTATVNSNATSVTVNSGTTVSYAATVSTGYSFSGWYNGGTLVSSANPYSHKVTANITLTAKATANSYTITAVKGDYISSVSGSGTYTYGTSCTLKAVINSTTAQYSYTFDGWYDGSTRVSTNTSYTFTVSAGKTYTAKATRILRSYAVSLAKNTYVSSVSGAGTYNYGTNVTITATLPANTNQYAYTFNGWYNDSNTLVSSSLNYQFTVGGAVSLTAKATRTTRTYTATANGSTGGTANVDGQSSKTVNYNTSVTFTAVPNAYYEFVNWSDGSTSNPRTVTITSNTSLTAYFKKSGIGIGVKVSGIWKNCQGYVKVNGAIKEIKEAYTKVNGVWKQGTSI